MEWNSLFRNTGAKILLKGVSPFVLHFFLNSSSNKFKKEYINNTFSFIFLNIFFVLHLEIAFRKFVATSVNILNYCCITFSFKYLIRPRSVCSAMCYILHFLLPSPPIYPLRSYKNTNYPFCNCGPCLC